MDLEIAVLSGIVGAIIGALINVSVASRFLAKAKDIIDYIRDRHPNRYKLANDLLDEAFATSIIIIANAVMGASFLIISIIHILQDGTITPLPAFLIGYGVGAIITALTLRVSAWVYID